VPLRLLFLNRSYYPDVEATGQPLTELCSDLARQHEVTVIAGRPNNAPGVDADRLPPRETHAGVRIVRVGNRRFDKRSFFSRVVGLLSYLLLAVWAALRQRRPDVIVVETDPPVLGTLGAFLKVWHRCRLVFYLQDLYPEVGLILGRLKPGLLTALLHRATQLGLRHADRVVVLGEDMRRRVLARGIPAEKIAVVPNWVDVDAIRPLGVPSPFRAEVGTGDRFVVMYSGNLGLSQNLEQVLEAARVLRDEPVLFLLVGEGAARSALEERVAAWKLDNVCFRTYQPKEKLAESLGAAEVHLIPLRRGLAGCIVPSKLYGILAAVVAYIVAADKDSEAAWVAEESGSGLRIEPDDAGQLVEAIRWCLAHRDELRQMGRRGRELAESTYSRGRAVARFADVLREAARVAR
jgi:glycosyltransferase involved in cell wall biosynthesis